MDVIILDFIWRNLMKLIKSSSLPVLSLALLLHMANASAFDIKATSAYKAMGTMATSMANGFKNAGQKLGFGDKGFANGAVAYVAKHPVIFGSAAVVGLLGAGYLLAQKFSKAKKAG
jgi:hypothetical protein